MTKLPEFVEFRYSEPEWDQIKSVVRNAGIAGKKIEFERRTIEGAVVSAYLPQAAINRQRLDRDELETLRKDAEKLRARITAALAEHFNIKSTKVLNTIPNSVGEYEMLDAKVPRIYPHASLRPGVDRDMLNATSDYFAKLLRNLNRQITKTEPRTRGNNARKPERDELWSDLLSIWIDIGGKPTGKATANFLIAASTPAKASADIAAVEKWLKRRRQSKTVEKVTPMQRRRATR